MMPNISRTAPREGLISEIAGPGRHPRVLDDQRDGVEDLVGNRIGSIAHS